MSEKWNERIFYHGTNNPEFQTFDVNRIGSAHDSGWYGAGFYFCFSAGEASYYGPYVRKAKLDIKKPFLFMEELQTMEGQHLTISGDLAIFAIQLSEKFPEIAKDLMITAVKSFDNTGAGIPIKISFPEYAKQVKEIFDSEDLKIFPCYNRDKIEYHYQYKDDYNCIIYRFDSEKDAQENRLNVAAYYVNNRIYAYLEGHMPEYFMETISNLFTEELKHRGYDGIVQSEFGDEIICFNPEQVMWL